MKILAIDPDKSKTAGCVHDAQTHEHRSQPLNGPVHQPGRHGPVQQFEKRFSHTF